MNGSVKLIANWLKGLEISIDTKDREQCLFCPPACYLSISQQLIESRNINILLGSQNIDLDDSLSVTGGISASMLRDFNCKYVIIGHSERRKLFNESEEELSKKIIAASKEKLGVIYCVGESKDIKTSGNAHQTVKDQLSVLKGISLSFPLIIAYEPVWSIGTGDNAEPDYICDISNIIRRELDTICGQDQIPVFYGGSVDSSNTKNILKDGEVDGLLIGGSSLDENKFSNIVKIGLNN